MSDIVAEDLPAELREHAAVRSACIGGAISERDYKDGLLAAGLADVEVTERMVYDEAQLLSVVAVDAAAADGLPPGFLASAAAQAAGRVWSAKFVGRRP